jgi:hypothetical protein
VTARSWFGAAAAVLVVVVVVALAGGTGTGGQASTLSRGPGGWLAARRYLEARGASVTLITEPLARFVAGEPAAARPLPRRPLPDGEGGGRPAGRAASAGPAPAGSPSPGVLVLAFPWQSTPTAGLDDAIDAHLLRGGDVVVAYSGAGSGAEAQLRLWRGRRARTVPLAPWRWWSFVHREWSLRPAAALASPGLQAPVAGLGTPGAQPPPPPAAASRRGAAAVRIWAPRELPAVSPRARILFTSPAGQPVIAVEPFHGGRVVLLPADALANARLGEPGNADLLESLRATLGARWAFDEYHHGLVTVEEGNSALGRAADLLAAHAVLLYLLGALALAWPQGPAWREAAPLARSASSFLLGLGALHHRLGHHREAAQLLLRRSRELDRGLALPAELDAAAAAAGPRQLVAIARQVARRRAGQPPTDPGESR